MMMDCTDEALAEKLKREDPEQFHTLVRMHLSFVLDLQTDECDGVEEKSKSKSLKWTFSKKVKGITKGVMEGAPLTQEGICQVFQLIEFLSLKENICQEGIFRRTGKLTRQQNLKSLLNQGITLNLNKSQFSVHDCASVLKSFLAELPEPLLTEAHFPAYCQLAELCTNPNNEAKLLMAIQLLLLLLPSENYVLLKDLLQLLNLTASYESSNKMSAQNLATLFTPHLLCPRRLTPEAFHSNSQTMSRVVDFMIRKGVDLLSIPPKLAADIRAYWTKKENRRKLTPQKELDESINDGTATAATIFTFLDRENTSKVYTSNPTEAALAELYAHVQSLPESSQKRKLIKQYNKANGNGTPVQIQNKHLRSKSLGDSIKKHIFNKTLKHNRHLNGEEQINFRRSISQEKIITMNSGNVLATTPIFQKSLPCDRNKDSECMGKNVNAERLLDNKIPTSQPDIPSISIDTGDDSSRLSDTVEEETRKCFSNKHHASSSLDEEVESGCSPTKSPRYVISHSPDLAPCTPVGPVTTTRHQDAGSSPSCLSSYSCSHSALPGFVTPLAPLSEVTNTNKPGLTPRNAWSTMLMTSTPAPVGRELDTSAMFTPVADGNNSMSPITRSTQRMSKAMQETMMTPRSRKPVLALSGTNLCQLANLSSSLSPETTSDFVRGRMRATYDSRTSTKGDMLRTGDVTGFRQDPLLPTIGENSPQEIDSTASVVNDQVSNSGSGDSLTSTFRSYLFSRSVLTASPVDLSFSSRTGDFDTGTSSIDDSSKEALSDSLLYCLNGHDPPDEDSVLCEGSYCSDILNSNSISLQLQDNNSVPAKTLSVANNNTITATEMNANKCRGLDKHDCVTSAALILKPKLFGKSIVHETSL